MIYYKIKQIKKNWIKHNVPTELIVQIYTSALSIYYEWFNVNLYMYIVGGYLLYNKQIIQIIPV